MKERISCVNLLNTNEAVMEYDTADIKKKKRWYEAKKGNIYFKQILCLHALHRSSGNARILVSANTIRPEKSSRWYDIHTTFMTQSDERKRPTMPAMKP